MRREYQMAAAFMLADNYGVVRLMSSYSFSDSIEGPPMDSVTNMTLPVITSPDMECDGGWVCEHRWSPIANMVEFRNAVAGTNRSRFEVLSSGVLLLNRGAVGLFVLTPDGIMDELINTADGTAWLTINNTDVPFVAFCVDCGE
ncbi:hypothetical protein O3P69_016355 [Scylla paramamosain]|uniref:Uncharacterized protein n=1 Tax=Scylla paramamosain TaxID=85552 RepID=A0AAW0TDR7_SCYPA